MIGEETDSLQVKHWPLYLKSEAALTLFVLGTVGKVFQECHFIPAVSGRYQGLRKKNRDHQKHGVRFILKLEEITPSAASPKEKQSPKIG